jgi:hypothetical protein
VARLTRRGVGLVYDRGVSEATPSPRLWSCPSCGRRVPLRAPVCHCGTTRERALELAAAAPAVTASARPVARGVRGAEGSAMPRDVRLLFAGAALFVLAGLGWAALGPEPRDATTPVLGWIDPGPPDPATLLAKRAPPAPPFKLPWWK